MPKIKKLWPAVVLVTLFIASVLIRLSSFGVDPMAHAGYTSFARFNNNEVWVHNKIVFDVYQKYPVSTHLFASYIGGDPAGEFLHNKKAPELIVYTSFPAVHFAVPYIAFKLLHMPFTFTSLQLFGLAIQALCVGLIYYLVLLLTRNKLVSVLGASIYIFSTATLQYHMNVYWAHDLLMPVFLTALIIFVRNKGMPKWWQSLLLGLVMSAITWTGAVAAVGFAVYGGYKFWRTKNRAYLSHLYMLLGMVVALGLLILQVLLVTGASLPEYLHKVLHRAQARSAGVSYTSPPVLLWQLCNDLFLDYGGYIVIAHTLAAKQKLKKFEWEVLFVAAFPLLESFVILEHDTVYGFGLLKWLVPIIILICVLGNRYANTKKRRVRLVGGVVVASVLHAALYLVIFNFK